MTFEELKALDDAYIMHTYGRFPVDIDHGEGATLYSLSGRKYIDFTSGIIGGGMIPKIQCCVDALEHGVHRAHILDGRIPHSILTEMLSHKGIGTMLWE